MINFTAYIELNNIISIIVIASYFLLISFAWLLPLFTYFKKTVLALQFAIPVSISIQIIFAYVFYTFALSVWYILPYLGLILISNLLAIQKIGLANIKNKTTKLIINQRSIRLPYILLITVIISLLIFTRFYDSFSTLAPGNNDTYNHIQFLKSIREYGFITLTYYAPGFHLLLLPLTFVLPYSELYRFVGPVMGCFTILALWLLIRPALRKKNSPYLFFLLLLLPIFNQLTLQTIGFFSSNLSFMYLVAFLMLLGFSNNRALPGRYSIAILLTVALSLIVPYFFVQYTIALGLLLLVGLINKHLLPRAFIKRLAFMTLISFSGLLIGLAHTTLQTSVHSATYFPSVSSNAAMQSEIMNRVQTVGVLQNKRTQQLAVTSISPFIANGLDLISIKAIRSPEDVLGAGAYGWIIISCVLMIISLIQQRKSLFVLAFISIIYGIITQTGMFELTTYKGRSGWYLLLLTILGLMFIFDRFAIKFSQKYLKPILLVSSLTSIFIPPVYYRAYHTDQFNFLAEYVVLHREPTIVYAGSKELALLDDGIKVVALSSELIDNGLQPDSIVIINKEIPNIDPILSQQGAVTDEGFVIFAQSQEKGQKVIESLNNKYLRAGGCSHEHVLFETSQTLFCTN